ncbi:hypothetical protein DVH24_032878 [Malus domestica]|uniref:Uncharacterized protein n=1 Tax=Malus domestica TaxID=3750 RepID=A0A498IQU1_MALDO|nr:hypothetical protein DVH24_032878 [Malus domestica]
MGCVWYADGTGRDGTGRNEGVIFEKDMGYSCLKMVKHCVPQTWNKPVPGGKVERKNIQNLSRGTARSTHFWRTKRETERLVPSRPTPDETERNGTGRDGTETKMLLDGNKEEEERDGKIIILCSTDVERVFPGARFIRFKHNKRKTEHLVPLRSVMSHVPNSTKKNVFRPSGGPPRSSQVFLGVF